MSEKGRKDNEGKLRWDLLPLEPIQEVVKAFTYGAKKYSENNWQKVENFNEAYYAALMRHLYDWRTGKTIDGESKLRTLSQVAWNALALLWKEMKEEEQKSVN